MVNPYEYGTDLSVPVILDRIPCRTPVPGISVQTVLTMLIIVILDSFGQDFIGIPTGVMWDG